MKYENSNHYSITVESLAKLSTHMLKKLSGGLGNLLASEKSQFLPSDLMVKNKNKTRKEKTFKSWTCNRSGVGCIRRGASLLAW